MIKQSIRFIQDKLFYRIVISWNGEVYIRTAWTLSGSLKIISCFPPNSRGTIIAGYNVVAWRAGERHTNY